MLEISSKNSNRLDPWCSGRCLWTLITEMIRIMYDETSTKVITPEDSSIHSSRIFILQVFPSQNSVILRSSLAIISFPYLCRCY